MKKTLIAVAAAAALTTSAFAEITFGAWLRVLTAPVASDGKDTVAAMGNSWGWGARAARVDIRATSEDEKVGFVMGVYDDKNNGIGKADDGYMWAKPVDAVKVSVGRFDNPTPLRGDFCYGSWNWLRPTDSWLAEDEGLLMSGKQNDGLKIEVTPVDGLYILAMAPIDSSAKKADDVYKNLQVGFAYNIEGVGKIKAQFFGKNTAKTEKKTGAWVYTSGDDAGKVATFSKSAALKGDIQWNPTKEDGEDKEGSFDKTIEAAFDLTSVENLYVGVGFQMKMIDKMEDRKLQSSDKMKIALAASYQVSDELKVSASGAYFTYQKGKSDNGMDPRFQAGVGVDYNLGDGMNLSADVRYLSKANDIDNTDSIAFSVGVTKGISSNGYMGVAFQGQTNSGSWANNVITGKTSDDAKADKFTWCVPVAMSVWF